MGMGAQRHTPAALPPGKTRYPLYRRLGGLQGQSGRVRKISPPTKFDLRTVQPVASRCTDWAILAHPSLICVSSFPAPLTCPPSSLIPPVMSDIRTAYHRSMCKWGSNKNRDLSCYHDWKWAKTKDPTRPGFMKELFSHVRQNTVRNSK